MSELPAGWAWAKVGDIAEIGPRSDCQDDTNVGFVPLHRLGVTFRSRHTFESRRWAEVRKGYTHFANGDVLLARITPSFENGKAGIARDLPNGLGAGSTEYFVCRPKEEAILPEYLLAHFKTGNFLRNGEQVMSGAVGQQRVPKQYLLDSKIPLAPFTEQKRITAKLDALLTRVDSCTDRLIRAPGILKRFRQSILVAATTGELTREWRDAHAQEPSALQVLAQIANERVRRGLPSGYRAIDTEGVEERSGSLPDTWTWCRVGNIADVRLGGTPARSEQAYWNGNIPWVSSGEVANSRITNTSEKITRAGLENSNAKVYPRGTVLIAMIGEGKTRGQSALLDIDASTNQNVAGLVFETNFVEPEYIWYWALSEYEQTRSVGRGGNQPALNGAKVRALPVPLPPTAEQRAIVARVSGLFALADEAERRLAAASRTAERLPSLLLAKAFRGELVPQDPSDEPTSRLLARLRTDTNSASNTNKPINQGRRGSRTKAKVNPSMRTRKDVSPNHLTTILKERGSLTAEALWTASQLEIDDFYAQLKEEEARGWLRENRGDASNAPRLLEAAG